MESIVQSQHDLSLDVPSMSVSLLDPSEVPRQVKVTATPLDRFESMIVPQTQTGWNRSRWEHISPAPRLCSWGSLFLCSLPELSRKPDLLLRWGCEVGAGFHRQLALLSNGRSTLSFIDSSAKWGWQWQCWPHRVVMVLGGGDLCKIFSMNTGCVIRMINFYIAQVLRKRRHSTFDLKMLLPVVLCYAVLPHYIWNNPWISSPFPSPDFIFGPRCMYFPMPWISWNGLHTT